MIARWMMTCALASLIASCASPLTELVVVVDTDFAVPGGLDQIDIVVTEPDATEETASASLASTTLPVTLGVVHRAGELGPVRIEAIGRRAGAERVRRAIVTSFVSGESRLVRLDLFQSCETSSCGTEQTCAATGCTAVAVPGTDLPRFTGVERLDASSFDAGPIDAPPIDAPPIDVGDFDGGRDANCTFTSATEACDTVDQDCDGLVDEGACVCDPPCALDNAVAICTAARTCAISSCNTGFGNCDMQPETGCERSIHTNSDCGGCDRPCTSTAGTTTCADGTCRIQTCTNPRFSDCNGEVGDGCEANTETSALHCGECNNPCPSPMRCRTGVCS